MPESPYDSPKTAVSPWSQRTFANSLCKFGLDENNRRHIIRAPDNCINTTVVSVVGELPFDLSKLGLDIPRQERLMKAAFEIPFCSLGDFIEKFLC